MAKDNKFTENILQKLPSVDSLLKEPGAAFLKCRTHGGKQVLRGRVVCRAICNRGRDVYFTRMGCLERAAMNSSSRVYS